MPELDQITVGELRSELDRVESKTPTLRLVVGLNYKHGATQTEIAEQYGLARKTVYNWLKRLETQPLEQAIVDADRPGRPPKLSSGERKELAQTLRQPPSATDYSVERWTTQLVKELVVERFGVEYSTSHIRRLMRETGLSPAETAWVYTGPNSETD